jgi:hypothetical protein
MRRATCAAALAALLLAREAQALTGNQLYELCGTNLADGSFCQGFVVGGFEMSVVLLGRYCLPAGVPYRQVIDVFSAFLRDHPERHHEPAVVLLQEALANAFPC